MLAEGLNLAKLPEFTSVAGKILTDYDLTMKLLEKKVPMAGTWLEIIQIADKSLGEQLAKSNYDILDRKCLYRLEDAYRRTQPKDRLSLTKPKADAIWDAASRMLASTDDIAQRLLADPSPFGLNAPPLKNQNELDENSRFKPAVVEFKHRQKANPVSAANPYRPKPKNVPTPPGTIELSARDRKALDVLTREFRQHRAAMDRLNQDLKLAGLLPERSPTEV